MTNPIFRTGGLTRPLVAAVFFALPAPAFADLTSQELWSQWQEYMQSFGYDVAAQATPADGGLTVTGLSMSLPMNSPEGSLGTMKMTFGEVRLTDQADGTVLVTVPESTPLTVDVDPVDEEPVKIVMNHVSPDFRAVASGTATDTHYDYSASIVSLVLQSVTSEGKTVEPGTVRINLNGLAGTSDMDIGDAFVVQQDLTAASLDYTVDIRNPDPNGTGTFKMNGEVRDLASSGGGTIPKGADMTRMGDAMRAGYAVHAAVTYAAGMMQLAFEEGAENFAYASSSEGGEFDVSLAPEGLKYDVSSRTVKMHVEGSEIPFPADFTAEEIGLGINLPVMASDDQQDFGAVLTLAGVTLPDPVWGMADPGGALSHDPLTVRLDLAGKGRLMVDLLDEEQMTQLGASGGMPGMVESLTLNQLQLKAAGAEVSATADLTVDNQAMSPMGPFPNVFGTADIRMTNVLALARTLSQMGLIPQGQAMMIAGMLQQLGEPVSGPDDLKALVELSQQGALTVNGNPIPLQ